MNLRDKFVGLRRHQGKGFEIGSVRPLPGIPDAGEGEGSRLGGGDGEHALDGLGCLRLLRRR